MVRGIAWILLLCGMAAFGQTRIGIVSTVSQLDTLYPGQAAAYQLVMGNLSVADWGEAKLFRWDSTSTAATNPIVRGTRTAVGRWIHDWDGDVSAFGVLPSEVDVSVKLNAALQYAASNGVVAKIVIPGRYAVTNSVEIPSNCKFDMHPDSVLIRKFRSDSGGFSVPQEATVRNSGLTGWQTLGELSLVNSNILLRGLRCRTEDTNYMGFHVFMQGVSDLEIDRPFIEQSYRAWALTVAASNCVINLPKIRNGGESGNYVYQDGIHVTGGSGIRIVSPDIVSGDDSIGFGQHSMPIRDVVVQGGVLRSTHAQMLRGFVGYDYATNYIERIGIYNVSGGIGRQNAILQTGTSSTNVSRPFRNWIIDGLLADSGHTGTNVVAFDAGLIVRNFDGLLLKNATVPYSLEPNLLLLDCDNTTVEDCYFGGTGWTTYNQSIRVERAENLRLLNNRVVNANTFSAYGLYLVNSGATLVEGNTFDTWATCIALAGTNRYPAFRHNRITATGGSQRGLAVIDLPTSFVFEMNEVSAPSVPTFSGGTVSDSYVVRNNIGYANPNSDLHARTNTFGPHVRFVQSGDSSTNGIYSATNRFRFKSENSGLFFASWDPSSIVYYTLGDSSGSTSPRPGVILGESASGTNVAAGSVTLRTGNSTGSATPPGIILQASIPGVATNATAQTAVALATFQAPVSPGTNQSAMKLYFYSGTSWVERQVWSTNIGGVNYLIHP